MQEKEANLTHLKLEKKMREIIYAMKHTCGKYFPHLEGVTGDIAGFIYQDKICQACGKDMPYSSLTKVKGYFRSKARWYNPFTWFTSEFVEI